jgi:bacterioferritin-associated ferredoxin
MIVCVCKSVSDRHIHEAIREGARSLEELQLDLGVALCCGRCESYVLGMLEASDACAAASQKKEPWVRENRGSLSFELHQGPIHETASIAS